MDFIKGKPSHIDSVLAGETTWMRICTRSGKTEAGLLWAAITLTRWLPANLWPKVICSYWEYHSTEHYISLTQFSKNSTAFPLSAIYSSLLSLGELPEPLVLGMEICRQILKPANTSHRTLVFRWVDNIIGQGVRLVLPPLCQPGTVTVTFSEGHPEKVTIITVMRWKAGQGKWKLGVEKGSCKKEVQLKRQKCPQRCDLGRAVLPTLFKNRLAAACRIIMLMASEKGNLVPALWREEIHSYWRDPATYNVPRWMV